MTKMFLFPMQVLKYDKFYVILVVLFWSRASHDLNAVVFKEYQSIFCHETYHVMLCNLHDKSCNTIYMNWLLSYG